MTVDQNTLRRRGVGLRAHDPERSFGGYTLYTPIAGPGEVFLVDIEGKTVHTWNPPHPPGRHARLLPNGNLFYQGKDTGGPTLFPIWDVYHGGILQELAPDGAVVREVRHPFHHHDASVLRNGNLLVLGVEPLAPADAARVRGGIPGSEAAGGVIHGDVVYELTWDGEVVWRWAAIEHLDPEQVPLDRHFAREHWPMANTVGELSDGGVVVGFRSASTTVAVDRADGSVRWRIGPGTHSQQHYPHELPGGNILVFDNGTYRDTTSVPYSRVLEIDPRTGEEVWSYEDNPPQNFYSPYMSSAQRLPGGNTFIAEGSFGRLFEVTPDGEVVWEYMVPEFGSFGRGVGLESSRGAQNSVFRAYRYAAEEIPWL
ncbi:PQQ-binding-like beta-propeller repeat protein [Streptomyces sp. CJ_13]|uniref:aryl-sulfate sulfotransferase n=1 Tax=Streptomyces sp. CJ_13 TaxID=2724943 RepID=UPI001BDC5799|nr:aryl-sulfate sulfotransferase [Streptomyces sp. CJ_13]MBT1187450.1 PQQ-binding-like beta-propeller repeat protein [Streptomyces sp. CJ_13]